MKVLHSGTYIYDQITKKHFSALQMKPALLLAAFRTWIKPNSLVRRTEQWMLIHMRFDWTVRKCNNV